MPRRREVPKRKWLPDPKYRSASVTRFMNVLMLDGKKSVAEKIVYGAFDLVAEKTKQQPLEVFELALQNCMPDMEVKSRRVGGANYQVPVPVRQDRRMALSMRWLIQFARKRSGRTMREKLAAELIEAANQRGNAFKKREDTHKMAEANKALSHFRW